MTTRRIRLTSVDDELVLILDQTTLDAVGYDTETEIEVRVEGESIVIEPISNSDGQSADQSPKGTR